MKINDKERLDWLLDNRDLGVVDPKMWHRTLWIDTRKQIDDAIRASRSQEPGRGERI